jgi:hypothetical protein
VRVVITTNFDRLIETALADVGIQPVVISTADATKGALPLAHQQTLIVKINGDYLDSRIKNTVQELDKYEPELDSLLDRIFDEFGLIVCGWSADWDTALRRSIERCPSRRFSTFWCAKGTPTAKAADLITLRGAITVSITSADSFFSGLREKVVGLTELERPHPITGRLAGAQVKRYLVRAEDRIRLHDLVHAEMDRKYAGIIPATLRVPRIADYGAEIRRQLNTYNALIDILLPIISTGCYWGDQQYAYLWRGMISRLGDPPGSRTELTRQDWAFQQYPATALMYAGGIASLLSGRLHNLGSVLKAPVASSSSGKKVTAAYQLNFEHVMSGELHKFVPGINDRLAPLSDYLFDFLKPTLAESLRPDENYDFTFVLFEYLAAVTAWFSGRENNFQFAPIGRGRWSHPEMFAEDNPRIAEIATHLFSTIDQYRLAKTEYDRWVLANTPHWG